MVICDFNPEHQRQKRQSRDSRRLHVTLSASEGSGYRQQILRRSAPHLWKLCQDGCKFRVCIGSMLL